MTTDLGLGAAELMLATVSLGLLLLVALRRPATRVRVIAVALGVFTALTAAQPFGVVAKPTSPHREAGETPSSPATIHRAGGIFAFRLYRRPTFRIEGESGDPTHTLRLRTGLWPALLTHQRRLTDLCGSIDNPCWDPRFGEQIELFKTREGRWRLLAPTGYAKDPHRPPDVPAALAWDLGIGVVSVPALVWWSMAGVFAVAIVTRRRADAT
jgi:hypothetical protein